MFHKESMEMPLTIKNLVSVTSARVPHERPHSGTSVLLSYPSILVYLVAIRHHHLELGYHNPLVDKPLLTYLCRGIPHHQGKHMRVRLPLTSAMLTSLHPALSHSNTIRDRDKAWAALTLGFHTSSGGTSAWPNHYTITQTDPYTYRSSCTLPGSHKHHHMPGQSHATLSQQIQVHDKGGAIPYMSKAIA